MNNQLQAPAALHPWKRAPGTNWKRGWVGPRTSLDVEKRKIAPLQGPALRPLGHPGCNESLYWPSCPGSPYFQYIRKIAEVSQHKEYALTLLSTARFITTHRLIVYHSLWNHHFMFLQLRVKCIYLSIKQPPLSILLALLIYLKMWDKTEYFGTVASNGPPVRWYEAQGE